MAEAATKRLNDRGIPPAIMGDVGLLVDPEPTSADYIQGKGRMAARLPAGLLRLLTSLSGRDRTQRAGVAPPWDSSLLGPCVPNLLYLGLPVLGYSTILAFPWGTPYFRGHPSFAFTFFCLFILMTRTFSGIKVLTLRKLTSSG